MNPSIQSEEYKLSIIEIVSEEFVNIIRSAGIKRITKIKILNNEVLEYFPDGSTSTSFFSKSVIDAVKNLLQKNQTFFDIFFRVIFIEFAECVSMNDGQITSLLLIPRLQLENIHNVSMKYFQDELHFNISYNE